MYSGLLIAHIAIRIHTYLRCETKQNKMVFICSIVLTCVVVCNYIVLKYIYIVVTWLVMSYMYRISETFCVQTPPSIYFENQFYTYAFDPTFNRNM